MLFCVEYAFISCIIAAQFIWLAVARPLKDMISIQSVSIHFVQAAEERALKLEIEQQQIPRFETAQEQKERLKRELEQQEFGEVAVNFTLVKPQPEYIYHTSIPGGDPDEHECNNKDVEVMELSHQ